MRKRNASKKEIVLICVISLAMLLLGAYLNRNHKPDTKETASVKTSGSAVEVKVTATPVPTPTPNPTEKIATFFQGPKSWESRVEWSGKWGKEYYDGGSFGGFGCGLCCMANVYCSLTDYRCSPIHMYHYAKKVSFYEGGGAIGWGYIKETLQSLGFTCDVWRKPAKYEKFQEMVKESKACIVVVSSYDSECYWVDTPGHYVTLFLYDEATDKVFLADSGDLTHNRQWVPLKKIYRSLKTSNTWQYLAITDYKEENDTWKHKKIGGNCVLPPEWK